MNPPHTEQQENENVACAQLNQRNMVIPPTQMHRKTQIPAVYNSNPSMTQGFRDSRIVLPSLPQRPSPKVFLPPQRSICPAQEPMVPMQYTRTSANTEPKSVILHHPLPRRPLPPAPIKTTAKHQTPVPSSSTTIRLGPHEAGAERGACIHTSGFNKDQPPLLLVSSAHTSTTRHDDPQHRVLWHNLAPVLPIIQPPSSPDLAYLTQWSNWFPRIPPPQLDDDPIILEAIQISDRYLSGCGSVIPVTGVDVDVRLTPFIGFSPTAWKQSEALERGADELVAEISLQRAQVMRETWET